MELFLLELQEPNKTLVKNKSFKKLALPSQRLGLDTIIKQTQNRLTFHDEMIIFTSLCGSARFLLLFATTTLSMHRAIYNMKRHDHHELNGL